MFIAYAVFYSTNYGRTRLKICNDVGTEEKFKKYDRDNDTDSLFHMCYEKELAELIMQIAATKVLPAEFEFRGDKCILLSYSYNSEERFYNKYRVSYISGKDKLPSHSEIIVYTGKCRCPKCFPRWGYDTIKNRCGIVELKDNPYNKVRIDLQRCEHCLTYFIDRQSLAIYEKRYGKLNIDFCPIEEYVRRMNAWTDGFYAEDSILSRNGYYARYPGEVRRRALICMMENGISKAEIKNKLTEFIEHRSERCPMAAITWREDLEFVNDYRIEKQKRVEFKD